MNESVFTHTREQLQQFAEDVLKEARRLGASDAAVDVSEGNGLSVSVRKGEIETIEQNKDKGVGITVYLGQQRGSASTSDLSAASMKAAVEAAYNIARFTAEDEAAGLPDEDMLETSPQDLQLYHPWALSVEDAVEIAKRCEAAAFAVDERIANSEGATVQINQVQFMAAHTRGFMGGYPTSRHTISVSPIAGEGTHMQRDYWYSSKRDASQLMSSEAIGQLAAERAIRRLDARSLSSRKCPVLFEAPLAVGLLGAFVRAVSGGALYRKSSFLLDSLGEQIFAPHVQIFERPHLIGEVGSAPFDDEGVRTTDRDVVTDGVVQGYFLSSYSARRLGMKTTGNAGGAHNLTLVSKLTTDADDLNAMLKKLGTGLLVTELMGQGVNYVTGDYSRGASGFWVRNGEIQYPVEEITIAGNLKEMWQKLAAIGADTLKRGSMGTGSILIEEMTVAGS